MTHGDPVEFELVRSALARIGDEMARTMVRCAYSPIIRNSNDYSTSVLDHRGEVIAQGTNPIHLRSVMDATAAIRACYDRFDDGDVFVVNDPYNGGSHLPDTFLVKPAFHGGQLVGFVGSEAHQSDVGGRVPGSNAADSRELFEEGLIVPPSHLYRRGEPNRTMWDLLLRNTRFPERVRGDLGAQIAALEVGERAYLELVGRYGRERFQGYADAVLDHAERLARAEIAAWPDGEYAFEDFIDDDGAGDEPVPVRVRIRVRGDELEVDFAGTGAQAPSAINNPGHFTKSAAMVAIRCAMATDVPHNSGFMRPLRIDVPRGSILNPEPPAAVSARTLSAFRAFDATVGCLAQIVPERMMAATAGANALVTIHGRRDDGEPFVLADIHFGGWGARQSADGLDGMCSALVTISNTPVEVIERELPVTVTRYASVPDSCGTGRHRGGLALCREYRIECERAEIQVRVDRARVRPYGLDGGGAGTLGGNVVRRAGGGEEAVPAKANLVLRAGDRLACTVAGSGGWGPAAERDPDLVAADVADGRLSAGFARRHFGSTAGQSGGQPQGATGGQPPGAPGERAGDDRRGT